MKKIWKILTSMTIPALALTSMASLSSCSNKMYYGLKYIAPYLHELTFDDYTYDSEFTTTKDAEAFGCSSVRKGNFYGRNFDYIFNDTPEFVVRVKANKAKNRHESIGIATHFGLRESKLLNGDYDEQLTLVPNITLDGINDAGVVCSHNVVSMEADQSCTKHETNPNNPNAMKLHQLFVPRYILDNANNVDHAVQLLKDNNINIVGNLNNKHYLHIMIAGKDAQGNDKTVIVEFFDKSGSGHFEVVDEVKTGDNQIMTNFHCNNLNGKFVNDSKMGEERYAILKNDYENISNFSDMVNIMQKVMFSKAYNYFHNPIPMNVQEPEAGDLTSEWYSEFVPQSILYPQTGAFDYEQYMIGGTLFKQDYWNARILDYRVPATPAFWQTTHNSTYDMETKHLRVTVQEQYEIYFDYYL